MRLDTRDIAAIAVNALLLELHTWPKPGLVSRVDCGSHADMNALLLERSAHALAPYFAQLACAGADEASMRELRSIGLEAEKAMLRATGGVNTHRGAIFGLGLLCAAAGARRDSTTARDLGDIVRERWGAQIGDPGVHETTHGAHVWRRYGVGGARREAGAGFPHLYRIGWPALRAGRSVSDGDEVRARVHCLFALMASVQDTNLLHRGGVEGLLFSRVLATDFMQRGGVACHDWREQALRAHRQMVVRQLSPGGCADLLAMAVFVDAVHTACASGSRAAEAALV